MTEDRDLEARPPREAVHFPEKDLPLKADVGLLGALLGEVLQEQAGRALYDQVESLRKHAIARRNGDQGATQTLLDHVRTLSVHDATEITLAFSHYFSLVNLAERVHRIRRRREYYRADAPSQRGSWRDVVQRLTRSGHSGDVLLQALHSMQVEPVFTAHPTEAVRPALLAKQQRIARALVDRLERVETPREAEASISQVRTEVTTAWQTAEHLVHRPTVAQEVENLLFYLSQVIYRVIPPLYEEIELALRTASPDLARDPDLQSRIPTFVTFASWVGGDMDGNPNVGPATIRDTLERHREVILRRYHADLLDLAPRLTQSPARVPIAIEVLEQVDAYAARYPEHHETLPHAVQAMPYRTLVRIAAHRVELAHDNRPGGYESAEELLTDLRLVERSLMENRGRHAGFHHLRRLLRRVETFGFHLATLDVRQDALVHRQAVGQLLGRDDFTQLNRDERARLLADALRFRIGPPSAAPAAQDGPTGDQPPELAEVLEVLRTIRIARERYGPRAIGPYIISMAQGADDALALMLLGAEAGLLDRATGAFPLDIAPLFETVDDLSSARHTLKDLLADGIYASHLRHRENRQTVMLGYSDSSKDSGLAASRWALFRVQEDLVEEAELQGISIRFFHGRGGSISRGGSRPRDAVLAEPARAVAGRLRVTEQGEIIDSDYGLRAMALRTLELKGGATLESCFPDAGPASGTASGNAPDHAREVMEILGRESRTAFRGLVYGDPGFYPYFRAATPIDVIERMHIGSRPPSRRAQRGIGDLRAIPWVFSWMQSRHVITGWYGAAAGLDAAIRATSLDTLRELRVSWRFFANLLSDLDAVLGKADMDIAAEYAALAGKEGARIFAMIRQEFDRTTDLVCQIQETGRLLDRDPVLRRGILLRNPYVDPMSLVQVDLLRRWRADDRTDAALEHALFTTVKGIARGLQTTG